MCVYSQEAVHPSGYKAHELHTRDCVATCKRQNTRNNVLATRTYERYKGSGCGGQEQGGSTCVTTLRETPLDYWLLVITTTITTTTITIITTITITITTTITTPS